MQNLTCIICPIGCFLTIEEKSDLDLNITGNKCQRGAVYAKEEIRDPKRVVTASCEILEISETETNIPRRIPVKTILPCPKNRINDLLADLYRLKIKLPIKAGDSVLTNWQGTGINIVATRTIK